MVAIIGGLALVVVNQSSGVNARGAKIVRFTVDSPRVHQVLTETAVVPGGRSTTRRPLLVFLHGKGEDQDSNLSAQMFAALARLGSTAPDIVFPDGGDDSYWHDRRSGAWGSYVMREVIPAAVKRLGVDPRQIAIGGLSMGGFGAYDLARLNPHRFCAVGGDSAALWSSGGETAAGAFDDGADFERHDVLGAVETSANPYPGTRLWLDVGGSDPFRPADTALAKSLASKGIKISFHVWPGGHEQAYWQRHWSSYLAFYSEALQRC